MDTQGQAGLTGELIISADGYLGYSPVSLTCVVQPGSNGRSVSGGLGFESRVGAYFKQEEK